MPCRHRCRGCLVAWHLNGAAMAARRWLGDGAAMAGTLHRRPAGILMGLLFVFATQSNQQIPWFGKVTRNLKPSNSGCKWLKPAENTFTLRQWIFLPSKVQQIDTISVSGHSCMHFIWKFCQTVAGIRMIRQFHECFSSIFGGFLHFGPMVRRGRVP